MLAEQLETIRQGVDDRVPPDKRAIMHRATADLRASGILDRVIKVVIRCRFSRSKTRLARRCGPPIF